MKKQTFLKGAATIAVGSFLSKLLGALYRIPLLSLIGGEGMGLYQLVYPLYALLLSASTTGIPSAVAKRTAENEAKGRSDKNLLRTSFFLFISIGVVGSLIMVILAPLLSAFHRVPAIRYGCFALAPSVAIVAAIAVLRGFFQGKRDMRPTALSEIVEQAVKIAFGLLFAYLYRGNLSKTLFFLLLSVTLSEIAALLLLCRAKRRAWEYPERLPAEKVRKRQLLSVALPVTCSHAVVPLCTLLESIFFVRLMRRYTENALSLYGLYAGGGATIAALPVSLCYGLAVASLPIVAQTFSENGYGKRVLQKILRLLCFVALFSVCFAVGTFFFSDFVLSILYKGLSKGDKRTLSTLVKILAFGIPFRACSQTLSAALTAQGKQKHALFSACLSGATRLFFGVLLVGSGKFSIYGGAIAANIGNFVAFFLDLLYNIRVNRAAESKAKKEEKRKTNDYDSRLRHHGRRFDESGGTGDFIGEKGTRSNGV